MSQNDSLMEHVKNLVIKHVSDLSPEFIKANGLERETGFVEIMFTQSESDIRIVPMGNSPYPSIKEIFEKNGLVGLKLDNSKK